jgi:transketolase
MREDLERHSSDVNHMSLLLTAVTTATQETAIAMAEAKEAKAEITDLKYEVEEANIGVAEAKAEAEEAKEEAERAKEVADNAKKAADEAKENAKRAEDSHTVEKNYIEQLGSRSPNFTCGSASFFTSFGTTMAGCLTLGLHIDLECTVRLKIRVFSVVMSNGVRTLR